MAKKIVKIILNPFLKKIVEATRFEQMPISDIGWVPT